MRYVCSCLIIATTIILTCCGCGAKASVNVQAVTPHDATLTAVVSSASESKKYDTQTAEIHTTPDPALCTAYNALGVDVYLRNFPSIVQDIIATWRPAVLYEVVGRTDTGWYFVRIPPNGRGWAHEQTLRLVGDCQDTPTIAAENLRVADYKLPCRISSGGGDVVSLYNLPEFESQVVGELPEGYLMQTVQRTGNGWYYVTDFLGMLPDGWNQGWVYESRVHRSGPCDITGEPSPTVAIVSPTEGETSPSICMGSNSGADRMNIHVNADLDSPVMSWIFPGETVRLSLKNAEGWVLVEYDAFQGWVRSDALEQVGRCENLPNVP